MPQQWYDVEWASTDVATANNCKTFWLQMSSTLTVFTIHFKHSNVIQLLLLLCASSLTFKFILLLHLYTQWQSALKQLRQVGKQNGYWIKICLLLQPNLWMTPSQKMRVQVLLLIKQWCHKNGRLVLWLCSFFAIASSATVVVLQQWKLHYLVWT